MGGTSGKVCELYIKDTGPRQTIHWNESSIKERNTMKDEREYIYVTKAIIEDDLSFGDERQRLAGVGWGA